MRTLKNKLSFIIILFASLSKAQFQDSLTTILNGKSSIDARIETRYSFIDNELINVRGVRLGVAYKRKLRIGGGISWLKSELPFEFTTVGIGGTEIDTVTKYLKFAYLSYYIDFVFHRTKRWQLSVPIQAGAGMSWFQTKKEYYLNYGDAKYFLLLYEPGITVQFKIFKWLGLGTDVGYRFVLKNNKKIGERLLSPTYSLKLHFWPDQVFYQIFPKHPLSKRKGPAEW
ncbi:MAG: hypothetical protein AB7O73_10250 [Bacteroidia bacterium]